MVHDQRTKFEGLEIKRLCELHSEVEVMGSWGRFACMQFRDYFEGIVLELQIFSLNFMETE